MFLLLCTLPYITFIVWSKVPFAYIRFLEYLHSGRHLGGNGYKSSVLDFHAKYQIKKKAPKISIPQLRLHATFWRDLVAYTCYIQYIIRSIWRLALLYMPTENQSRSSYSVHSMQSRPSVYHITSKWPCLWQLCCLCHQKKAEISTAQVQVWTKEFAPRPKLLCHRPTFLSEEHAYKLGTHGVSIKLLLATVRFALGAQTLILFNKI